MSYANYAATNQIHVFSCILIDVIIIYIIVFEYCKAWYVLIISMPTEPFKFQI